MGTWLYKENALKQMYINTLGKGPIPSVEHTQTSSRQTLVYSVNIRFKSVSQRHVSGAQDIYFYFNF